MYDEEAISLSPTEAFVLAMVKHGGLRSLYEFHELAGLSHGAVYPVLQKLEKLGLLESDFPKGQRKRTYRLTTDGESQLEVDWLAGCRKIPADSETLVRTAWVLSLFDRQHAREYLLRVAEVRFHDAEKIRIETLGVPLTESSSPIELFRYMQATMTAEIALTQAEVCKKLAVHFDDVKAGSKKKDVHLPKEKRKATDQ